MIQDSIVVKKRHQKFVEEASEYRVVWALENEVGYASSSSNHFEDKEGTPIKLVCFWSNRKLAKVCAKNDWEDYKPAQLSLEEFMENWCVGMYNDGIIVGTNFDWNMFGFEIEPLELILELTEKLKAKKKDLNFNKFDGIEDIEQQAKEIIDAHQT